MSALDAALKRLELDCEHMVGMEDHKADVRLLLDEVDRLRAELAESCKVRDGEMQLREKAEDELAAEREARATTLAGFHAEHVALAAERERAGRLEKALRATWPHLEVPVSVRRAAFFGKKTHDPGAPTCLRCKLEQIIATSVSVDLCHHPVGEGECGKPIPCTKHTLRPAAPSEESWFRGEVDEQLITKIAAEQPDLPLEHEYKVHRGPDPNYCILRDDTCHFLVDEDFCGQSESAHRRREP